MKDNWHSIDIRLIAVACSLAITAFTMLVPDTPNDDAYIYVRTAEVFLEDGLGAAFQHFSWASYSVLIGLISLMGFSLFTAAYLVNGLFFALLVYAFLSIIKEIDGSPRIMLMAALCILLYPQLNEYRYLIIRDPAYWALTLFSLWQLLLYNKNHKILHALLFCGVLLLAASFRSEALVYLILAPAFLLFTKDGTQGRTQRLLQACALSSLLLTWIILTLFGVDILGLLVSFFSVYESFLNSALNPSEAEASAIAAVLFGEHASAYSQEYIVVFMAVGMLVILAGNLFNGIGGPFFWLLVYGAYKRCIRLERKSVLPVLAYLLLNAAILFVFLYVTRYLTSRYAMLFCLLLALAVPQVLVRIVAGIQQHRFAPYGMRMLILFFAYCGFDSFISFGESKDYVFDSAAWVAERVEADSTVVTNNHAIAYFSGRVADYDKTQRLVSEEAIRSTRSDDLIALEMHFEVSQMLEQESLRDLLEFEAAFPSADDPQITIFRRR